MSSYGYICVHCAYQFELKRILDETPCPLCGCASVLRPTNFNRKNTPESVKTERINFARNMIKASYRRANDPNLNVDNWLKKVNKKRPNDHKNDHKTD